MNLTTLLDKVPGPLAAQFRHDAVLARVLRPLVNRLVPRGPAWVRVRSGPAQGLQLLIYPRGEKFYWTGTHEAPVQRAMANLLKPGMTFWDVGAHIGFFALLASRLVGESGQVHAFEPLDQNRQRLLVGIQRNGFTNITVHDCALAATSGEAVFHVHGSSLMWTLVAERGKGEGFRVRCCTLDELARSFPQPDLIKIDAEGAEVDVLRGGMDLLSTVRPLLIVEFSDDELLAQGRKLLSFYTFEHLAARHWLLK